MTIAAIAVRCGLRSVVVSGFRIVALGAEALYIGNRLEPMLTQFLMAYRALTYSNGAVHILFLADLTMAFIGNT